MTSRALCLCLLLLAAAASASAAAPRVNRYTVSFPEGAKRAHVEAELWLPSPAVSLFGVVSAKGLPNGQADLLENLKATDASGRALKVESLNDGDWRLGGQGAVRLSYDVRLEHDRYAWEAGVEEVAYRAPDGLMLTGSALFVAPTDASPEPATVTFRLPEGWRAITPWAPADGALAFHVPTRRELVSNALYLGTPHVERLRASGVELTLVLGKGCADQPQLFMELLRKQLASYTQLFGGPPLASRYVIIVNRGDTGDGGAFAGSFSQFLQGPPDPHNRVIWGHVMAHELLHFWNGHTLVPADVREEWFREGVTDYLTVTTMARNGFADGRVLRERLANIPRRVLLARLMQGLDMSVREAGERKQERRLLVYGGGSAVALALDVELRKRTQERKGLPDLMQALYAQHGRPGAKYGLADIERAAAQVSCTDFRDFFARAVESKQGLDLRPTFQDLGLRLDSFYEEQFVAPDPRATPAQKRRLRAVFGDVAL